MAGFRRLERVTCAGGSIRSIFRLGREHEGIALPAAGLGAARRLGLGDILGEDGDNARPALVRGDHDTVRLLLAHAEFALEDDHDELARRVVVVEQDDLVELRPRDLRLDLDAGFCDQVVVHRHLAWRIVDTAWPVTDQSMPNPPLAIFSSPRNTSSR